MDPGNVRLAAPWTTHAAAVSEAGRAAFDAMPVKVIPNGIEPERCQAREPRAIVRREWGVQPGEIVIGHVGRCHTHEKRTALSGPRGPRHGTTVPISCTGDSYELDRDLRAIQAVCPNFIFRPSQPDVGTVLRALDCYALIGPREGMSLALLEAWLCGVPTISTPVGAVPELEAEHGQLTIRVPVDPSPADIASAVRQAIAPENRATVERAACVVWEHYTVRAMAARWAEHLIAVCAAWSPADRQSLGNAHLPDQVTVSRAGSLLFSYGPASAPARPNLGSDSADSLHDVRGGRPVHDCEPVWRGAICRD